METRQTGVPPTTSASHPASATVNSQHGTAPAPTLNKARHTKYWLRCLKTFLPTAYQSNDSQRLSLAFFILSALDLLDELHRNISEEERSDHIDWVYRCQHPGGGFRSSPLKIEEEKKRRSDIPNVDGERQDNPVDSWHSANLGSTFFALGVLILLGDDLENVHRRDCLKWLRALQRGDGSFGESLGTGGTIEGGGDVRFCHLAAAVRRLLRPDLITGTFKSDVLRSNSEDIDVDGLVGYVVQSIVSKKLLAGSQWSEKPTWEIIRHMKAALAKHPYMRLTVRIPSHILVSQRTHDFVPLLMVRA